MKYKILFFLILVVAIFVRFIKLGSFPAGLTWDEAAIGYNAYGLITNHRDEWLKRTPIVFQSFGDFKSPLLIYITTLPVAVLGLTALAIRLPVALAGVGLVVVSFFLTKELTKKNSSALLAMLCTALSPWAIHYSRMAFESMLACFLLLLGTFLYLHWVESKNIWNLVFGVCSFALALYAYHSAKVIVPLLGIIFCLRFSKILWERKKEVCSALAVGLLVLLPIGYATVFGKANARAFSTTIVGKPNAAIQFVQNYAQHLSTPFLLHGKDITYRHSTMVMGVIYPIELLLFVAGVASIASQKKCRSLWWVPTLFFVGLIPASLGLDVPHSNRALLAFPWIAITAGIGMQTILLQAKKLWSRGDSGMWILILGIFLYSFVSYIQTYQRVYSSSIALSELGFGYDELMPFVRPLEGTVDHVYFTNTYGQAYIYILLFKRLTPMEYQHGGLANYTITNDPSKEATGKKNILVIGSGSEIPDGVPLLKEIKYPDGKVAFRVARVE